MHILYSISSPNPMFDHLLESSHQYNSNKRSNIWFGEEIMQVLSIEVNFTHLIWSCAHRYNHRAADSKWIFTVIHIFWDITYDMYRIMSRDNSLESSQWEDSSDWSQQLLVSTFNEFWYGAFATFSTTGSRSTTEPFGRIHRCLMGHISPMQTVLTHILWS